MTTPDPLALLFAYGTLMFPPVFAAVCGVGRASSPAELTGYACHRVRGQVYPVIVPRAAAITPGCVIDDVHPLMWQRLDAFEGPDYRRITVMVHDLSAGRLRAAAVYVARDPSSPWIDDHAWDAEQFAHRDLAHYLAAHG